MTKKELYICSKPLQYFNILNILKTNAETDTLKTIVIVGAFAGSYNFYQNVRIKSHNWDKVYFVKNTFWSYIYLLFISFNNLYTYVDNSSILGFIHFLKRFDVYVYEEGIGTYLLHAPKKKSLVGVIDKCFGVGNSYCTSSYLKGIYLYKPDVFRKTTNNETTNLIGFKYDFLNFLKLENENLTSLFEFSDEIKGILELKGKKILLYITEWQLDDDIIKKIDEEASKYDVVFIKPHPHIQGNIKVISKYTIIKSSILAEFFIANFLNNGNILTIYHNISSAVIYFQNHTNVIQFPPKDTPLSYFGNYSYDEICKMLGDNI